MNTEKFGNVIIDFDGVQMTLRKYFRDLLKQLWESGESFNGKRPFGNSGWQECIYLALIVEGYIKGSLDEDGYIAEYDAIEADKIINKFLDLTFS